jgi:hypothetical protein
LLCREAIKGNGIREAKGRVGVSRDRVSSKEAKVSNKEGKVSSKEDKVSNKEVKACSQVKGGGTKVKDKANGETQAKTLILRIKDLDSKDKASSQHRGKDLYPKIKVKIGETKGRGTKGGETSSKVKVSAKDRSESKTGVRILGSKTI